MIVRITILERSGQVCCDDDTVITPRSTVLDKITTAMLANSSQPDQPINEVFYAASLNGQAIWADGSAPDAGLLLHQLEPDDHLVLTFA